MGHSSSTALIISLSPLIFFVFIVINSLAMWRYRRSPAATPIRSGLCKLFSFRTRSKYEFIFVYKRERQGRRFDDLDSKIQLCSFYCSMIFVAGLALFSSSPFSDSFFQLIQSYCSTFAVHSIDLSHTECESELGFFVSKFLCTRETVTSRIRYLTVLAVLSFCFASFDPLPCNGRLTIFESIKLLSCDHFFHAPSRETRFHAVPLDTTIFTFVHALSDESFHGSTFFYVQIPCKYLNPIDDNVRHILLAQIYNGRSRARIFGYGRNQSCSYTN